MERREPPSTTVGDAAFGSAQARQTVPGLPHTTHLNQATQMNQQQTHVAPTANTAQLPTATSTAGNPAGTNSGVAALVAALQTLAANAASQNAATAAQPGSVNTSQAPDNRTIATQPQQQTTAHAVHSAVHVSAAPPAVNTGSAQPQSNAASTSQANTALLLQALAGNSAQQQAALTNLLNMGVQGGGTTGSQPVQAPGPRQNYQTLPGNAHGHNLTQSMHQPPARVPQAQITGSSVSMPMAPVSQGMPRGPTGATPRPAAQSQAPTSRPQMPASSAPQAQTNSAHPPQPAGYNTTAVPPGGSHALPAAAQLNRTAPQTANSTQPLNQMQAGAATSSPATAAATASSQPQTATSVQPVIRFPMHPPPAAQVQPWPAVPATTPPSSSLSMQPQLSPVTGQQQVNAAVRPPASMPPTQAPTANPFLTRPPTSQPATSHHPHSSMPMQPPASMSHGPGAVAQTSAAMSQPIAGSLHTQPQRPQMMQPGNGAVAWPQAPPAQSQPMRPPTASATSTAASRAQLPNKPKQNRPAGTNQAPPQHPANPHAAQMMQMQPMMAGMSMAFPFPMPSMPMMSMGMPMPMGYAMGPNGMMQGLPPNAIMQAMGPTGMMQAFPGFLPGTQMPQVGWPVAHSQPPASAPQPNPQAVATSTAPTLTGPSLHTTAATKQEPAVQPVQPNLATRPEAINKPTQPSIPVIDLQDSPDDAATFQGLPRIQAPKPGTLDAADDERAWAIAKHQLPQPKPQAASSKYTDDLRSDHPEALARPNETAREAPVPKPKKLTLPSEHLPKKSKEARPKAPGTQRPKPVPRHATADIPTRDQAQGAHHAAPQPTPTHDTQQVLQQVFAKLGAMPHVAQALAFAQAQAQAQAQAPAVRQQAGINLNLISQLLMNSNTNTTTTPTAAHNPLAQLLASAAIQSNALNHLQPLLGQLAQQANRQSLVGWLNNLAQRGPQSPNSTAAAAAIAAALARLQPAASAPNQLYERHVQSVGQHGRTVGASQRLSQGFRSSHPAEEEEYDDEYEEAENPDSRAAAALAMLATAAAHAEAAPRGTAAGKKKTGAAIPPNKLAKGKGVVVGKQTAGLKSAAAPDKTKGMIRKKKPAVPESPVNSEDEPAPPRRPAKLKPGGKAGVKVKVAAKVPAGPKKPKVPGLKTITTGNRGGASSFSPRGSSKRSSLSGVSEDVHPGMKLTMDDVRPRTKLVKPLTSQADQRPKLAKTASFAADVAPAVSPRGPSDSRPQQQLQGAGPRPMSLRDKIQARKEAVRAAEGGSYSQGLAASAGSPRAQTHAHAGHAQVQKRDATVTLKQAPTSAAELKGRYALPDRKPSSDSDSEAEADRAQPSSAKHGRKHLVGTADEHGALAAEADAERVQPSSAKQGRKRLADRTDAEGALAEEAAQGKVAQEAVAEAQKPLVHRSRPGGRQLALPSWLQDSQIQTQVLYKKRRNQTAAAQAEPTEPLSKKLKADEPEPQDGTAQDGRGQVQAGYLDLDAAEKQGREIKRNRKATAKAAETGLLPGAGTQVEGGALRAEEHEQQNAASAREHKQASRLHVEATVVHIQEFPVHPTARQADSSAVAVQAAAAEQSLQEPRLIVTIMTASQAAAQQVKQHHTSAAAPVATAAVESEVAKDGKAADCTDEVSPKAADAGAHVDQVAAVNAECKDGSAEGQVVADTQQAIAAPAGKAAAANQDQGQKAPADSEPTDTVMGEAAATDNHVTATDQQATAGLDQSPVPQAAEEGHATSPGIAPAQAGPQDAQPCADTPERLVVLISYVEVPKPAVTASMANPPSSRTVKFEEGTGRAPLTLALSSSPGAAAPSEPMPRVSFAGSSPNFGVFRAHKRISLSGGAEISSVLPPTGLPPPPDFEAFLARRRTSETGEGNQPHGYDGPVTRRRAAVEGGGDVQPGSPSQPASLLNYEGPRLRRRTSETGNAAGPSASKPPLPLDFEGPRTRRRTSETGNATAQAAPSQAVKQPDDSMPRLRRRTSETGQGALSQGAALSDIEGPRTRRRLSEAGNATVAAPVQPPSNLDVVGSRTRRRTSETGNATTAAPLQAPGQHADSVLPRSRRRTSEVGNLQFAPSAETAIYADPVALRTRRRTSETGAAAAPPVPPSAQKGKSKDMPLLAASRRTSNTGNAKASQQQAIKQDQPTRGKRRAPSPGDDDEGLAAAQDAGPRTRRRISEAGSKPATSPQLRGKQTGKLKSEDDDYAQLEHDESHAQVHQSMQASGHAASHHAIADLEPGCVQVPITRVHDLPASIKARASRQFTDPAMMRMHTFGGLGMRPGRVVSYPSRSAAPRPQLGLLAARRMLDNAHALPKGMPASQSGKQVHFGGAQEAQTGRQPGSAKAGSHQAGQQSSSRAKSGHSASSVDAGSHANALTEAGTRTARVSSESGNAGGASGLLKQRRHTTVSEGP